MSGMPWSQQHTALASQQAKPGENGGAPAQRQLPFRLENQMLQVYEVARSASSDAKLAYAEARERWQAGRTYMDRFAVYVPLEKEDEAEYERRKAAGASSLELSSFVTEAHHRAVKLYPWPTLERLEELLHQCKLDQARVAVRVFGNQKYLDEVEEQGLTQAQEMLAKEEVRQTMAQNPFAADEQPMLVEGLVARGLLCVVGGGDKGQKSNFMFDLAVSLASGAKVAGHFAVPVPARVLVFTAETRGAARAKICRRIARDRGLTAEQLAMVLQNLRVSDTVPQIGTPAGLNALEDTVLKMQADGWCPDLIAIDPAYMALGGDLDMARINSVGAVVLKADRLVQEMGATLLLVWHYSKEAQRRLAEKREPAQLGDLTGAGAAAAARQWLLLSYSEPYDPETGHSAVWLNAGIATTQSQTHLIQIDEGTFIKDDPGLTDGRTWKVRVQTGPKAFEAASKAKEATKQAKKESGEGKLRDKIANYLARCEPRGALMEEIRDAVGQKNKVGRMLEEMLQSLEVVRSHKAGDAAKAKRWRKPVSMCTNAETEQRLKAGEPFEEVVGEPA
jgi:hypothetical protein